MKELNQENNKLTAKDHPVLLFDGVCNLCNGFVQFVINQDEKKVFRFASLQSDFAENMLVEHSGGKAKLDTVILLSEKGEVFTKSDVSIEIFKRLGGMWFLLSFIKIIPKGVRDNVYDFISRNRYRLFGKKDQCMIPNPELKALFYS